MTFPVKAIRDGFGEGLLKAGQIDKRVVVLGCDISSSIRVDLFKEHFSERFFSMGIAEQNAAGVSAGLALAGLIPIYGTYAVFAAGRALDQIRTSICYDKSNVKICGAHGGISVGPDGATHQALEDIGNMRILPNMTVVVPCDSNQAAIATRKAILEIDGPVYIRTGREPVPLFTREDEDFEIGKAILRKDGDDILLIACGASVFEALKAAEILKAKSIHAAVLDLHTIKPIDKEKIVRYARKCGKVVTVEEHQIHGGMGSAVAEVLVNEYPIPMRFIGMNDIFGESGDPNELLARYGLDAEGITRTSLEFLKELNGHSNPE